MTIAVTIIIIVVAVFTIFDINVVIAVLVTIVAINHSMYIFLPFHWPRAHHVTCK